MFYESLGFEVFGGNLEENWLIMKTGKTTIGLFQGMFEENILTFNPKWDENANTIESYTDIRTIRQYLEENGIKIDAEVEEHTSGPASFMITDPDGNPILFDQHI